MRSDFKIKHKSDICIGRVADLLPGLLPAGRVVVITDANIDRLYHPLLARYDYLLVGTGETIKTLRTAEALYRKLIEIGADRSTFILGIGGGIVTDIAGFVASTYMRGLRFGFVPTTLLGQVDAGVGGKNGLNVDGYKNMVGTFSHPQFCVCDVELLRTLPDREFRAGLAEIVKAGILGDRALFELLEGSSFSDLRSDTALLGRVVSAAIRVKAEIVERDEREAGERRKLNLGHTLAHAIEKCSAKMNHGEAVAVGLAMISRAAVGMGGLSAEESARICSLLQRLGFSLDPPVEVRKLFKAVQKDKKNTAEGLFVVMPSSIGRCGIRKMRLEELEAVVREVRAES